MKFEFQVKSLLDNQSLCEIEQAISQRLDCQIENHPLVSRIVENELMDSSLDFNIILQFMQTHKKLIIEFGIDLLSLNSPVMAFAHGAAITYCIYIIFLEKFPDELLNYLKKRRIPKPKNVHIELINIRKKFNFSSD